MIGNDNMVIPTSGQNPRLAHEFINFMLDKNISFENFVNFNGYQTPLKSINPRTVVPDVLPENLVRGGRRAHVLRRRALPARADAGREQPVDRRLGRDQSRWLARPRSRHGPGVVAGGPRRPGRADPGSATPAGTGRRSQSPRSCGCSLLFVLPFYVDLLGGVRHGGHLPEPGPRLPAVVLERGHVRADARTLLSARPPSTSRRWSER